MDIVIDWWAIIGGTIAAMIIGAIWYDDRVFGQKWMKAAGLKKKDTEKNMPKAMALSVVRAFALAFVMYHFIYVVDAFHTEKEWIENSLITAAMAGVGFVWLTMKMHDVFENRKREIMAINIGFEFVTILLVGLVIGIIAG